MCDVQNNLTVFFEEPFWVGIFERYENERMSASKVVFGAEPKDYMIYEFILKRYSDLQFSPAVAAVAKEEKQNPKRRQRDIKRALEKHGIGTKSQQALKIQQEQNKKERKVRSREEKLAETERMFKLRQQKKKEKHRGR